MEWHPQPSSPEDSSYRHTGALLRALRLIKRLHPSISLYFEVVEERYGSRCVYLLRKRVVGRPQDRGYWRREISLGWRASTGGEECELCGCRRDDSPREGYFELKGGGGYWTCEDCLHREFRRRKERLYARGCRRAILVERRDRSKRRVWVILGEDPWLRMVEDSLEDSGSRASGEP